MTSQQWNTDLPVRPAQKIGVYPWVIPKVPSVLGRLVTEKGRLRKLKPREILQQENDPYDNAYLIRSGCVGQAVVNAVLYHKPLAMNLFTAGRLMGSINIFSGTASPRRLVALGHSEVVVLSQKILRQELEKSFEMYREMAVYAELSAKSELMGMELLFTMCPEIRLEALFATLLLSEGKIDTEGRILQLRSQAPGGGYARLPFMPTREAMRIVTYLSQVTFDRLFADWIKRGAFIRDNKKGAWINVNALTDALTWIRRKGAF